MIADSPIDKPGPKRLISLSQYHSRLSQTIIRDFIAARDDFSASGVHDCRVGIKRWRALASLLEAILPGFDLGSCRKELSRIFKAAGRVRDCHIQQELVRASGANRNWSLGEYYNELKAAELAARDRFVRATAGFDLQLLETTGAQIAELIPPAQTGQMLPQVFQQLSHDLHRTLRFERPGGFPEEDLHAIRVQCKETRYVVEIIRNCLSHRPELGDLDDRLREVHQPLGQWHDRDVALKRLTIFLASKRKKALREAAAYAAFGQELREAKDAALHAFEAAWGKLVRLIDKTGML